MTDNNENGIPASVLDQAAVAVEKAIEEYGIRTVNDIVDYDEREAARLAAAAALPILRPAIEAALLQRMIAESQDWDCTSECDFSGDGEDYEAVFTRPHLSQILRTYLPTATEGDDE